MDNSSTSSGLKAVVGVDHDPHVATAARNTGVYREVHVASADRLPLASDSMDSAFANCSLEHMDRLPAVLRSIHRTLRPGGPFLLSVVTDKFSEWRILSLLLRQAGELRRAESIDRDFDTYHHLVNPLPPNGWANSLEEAGFRVQTYIPIVPELTARLFRFVDQVWHLRQTQEEAGIRCLASTPRSAKYWLASWKWNMTGPLPVGRYSWPAVGTRRLPAL